MNATPRAENDKTPNDETSSRSPPTLRISAKVLGQLALPSFCPRCFWLTRHQRKLPYAIFPGIFSAIDSFVKTVVRSSVLRSGKVPAWLSDATGPVLDLFEADRRDFHTEVEGVLLTGDPDGMVLVDGVGWFVVDYKTARITKNQDALEPLYRVQLNTYGVIAEAVGIVPVAGLLLIYCEPPSGADAEEIAPALTNPRGFEMPFRVASRRLPIDAGEVRELAARAKAIYDLAAPPAGRAGCPDCEALEALLRLGAVAPNHSRA